MGTFHDNLGDLHGITVVVQTTGPTVYVGRCHEANDEKVVILDADEHVEGRDEPTREHYLQRAARWGVFKKHDHLVLPREQVESITPLGQLAAG
jgi:hypothetical protein